MLETCLSNALTRDYNASAFCLTRQFTMQVSVVTQFEDYPATSRTIELMESI